MVFYHILKKNKIYFCTLLKKVLYFVIIFIIFWLLNSGGIIMKAVITVVGKDTVGILAKVSSICAEYKINIIDVSQTVMDDMFCMIMMADISESTVDFTKFSDDLSKYGEENNLQIHTMHEDIFNSMHRI